MGAYIKSSTDLGPRFVQKYKNTIGPRFVLKYNGCSTSRSLVEINFLMYLTGLVATILLTILLIVFAYELIALAYSLSYPYTSIMPNQILESYE